jgi:hypothetical protein
MLVQFYLQGTVDAIYPDLTCDIELTQQDTIFLLLAVGARGDREFDTR